jgi:hypothetical protein
MQNPDTKYVICLAFQAEEGLEIYYLSRKGGTFEDWHFAEGDYSITEDRQFPKHAKDSFLGNVCIGMRHPEKPFRLLTRQDAYNIYVTEVPSHLVETYTQKDLDDLRILRKIEKLFKTLKPEEIAVAKSYIESL